jgi:serine/threonine protein kinase
MSGTSVGNNYTKHSRGPANYRAPELFHQPQGTWNNKVDIWALGCVLYELLIEKTPFSTEMDYQQYVSFCHNPGGLQMSPIATLSARMNAVLSGIFTAMVIPNPWERPRTSHILEALRCLDDGKETVWLTGCHHLNPERQHVARQLVEGVSTGKLDRQSI